MKRQVINWVGLILVGAAAAILTFNTLRSLAESCGFTGWQAWLLPIAVDAAGAVATNVWLTGKDSPEAVRFARTWALMAAAVSLAGNATEHGLAAYGLAAPWWVAVAVAVIPPLALVGTVHLMVLLSKADVSPGRVGRKGSDSEAGSADVEEPVDELLSKARELLAEDPKIGRGTLARAAGVTEWQARKALAETNGNSR